MNFKICLPALAALALPFAAQASEAVAVEKGPLDKAMVHTAVIDREVPIHIKNFDVDQARLGKSKHQDIARQMAQTVPHLLASDIVNEMREFGFTAVSLDQSESRADGSWVLEGKFTELNPGSQAARAWIGFGAGKSKVCVMGMLKDDKGSEMGQFAHCSNGLGWGESDSQLESDTERLGHKIAQFFEDWAAGKYSH